MIAGALVVVTLPLLLMYLQARAWRRRFVCLEEALRTYNNANAAVGRHVTALETELRAVRGSPVVPTPEQRPTASVAASPDLARVQESPAFGAAEQRLANLIRTRQSAAQLN